MQPMGSRMASMARVYTSLDNRLNISASVGVVESHPKEISALDLGDVVNDELVVHQRTLNKMINTAGILVLSPTPQGTYTYPRYFPLPGAVFPHPFVENLPGGRRLA